MQIIQAQCGSRKAHDGHWDRIYDRTCSGWSESNASACELAETLIRYSQLDSLHPDLFSAVRLECHPAVLAAIYRVILPDFPIVVTDPRFVIPVVTEPEMKHGAWRLVIADGAVK